MLGYMNKCPHCGADSSFVPEEMECDKSLVLYCRSCGDFVNQTLTLETIRRWWLRVNEGEEVIKPPITEEEWIALKKMEDYLNQGREGVDKIEIHLKDFIDYHYTEESEEDESTA